MRAICVVSLVMAATSVAEGPQSTHATHLEQKVAESQLRQLNREAAEMQVHKDVKAAERLLADDYLFLQADGNVSNKSQNVGVLGDAAFVCEALTADDVVVRVYGDVGVITGRAKMRATYDGQDIGGEFLYTDVWAKRDGRWQTVVSQATRRPSSHSSRYHEVDPRALKLEAGFVSMFRVIEGFAADREQFGRRSDQDQRTR
jgi:ketosteroid isomerase-like protein